MISLDINRVAFNFDLLNIVGMAVAVEKEIATALRHHRLMDVVVVAQVTVQILATT